MDFIRRLVSQKKIRFKDDEYDLDLSYITDRIIAMAYPADGVESTFRNRIDHVASFLQKYHENLFLIINASNRNYDFSKFNNNVISMNWPNHYPCPFEAFVRASVDILFYLQQNSNNVVAVHCLAGKGRTGSLVNAILYSSGLFKSIEEANLYYKSKRNVLVSYVSQIRYMKYYESFFDNGCSVMNFKPRVVEKFSITTSKWEFWFDKFFILSFIDFSKNDLVLAEIVIDGNAVKKKYDAELKTDVYVYKEKINNWALPQATEILVTLKDYGLAFTNKLFRVNFSMLMVRDKTLKFRLSDLDKTINLPNDFELNLHLYDIDDIETEQHLFKSFKELDLNLQISRNYVKNKENAKLLIHGKKGEL